MAGGAPIPIPTADVDEKILSIKDLEHAASERLGRSARGNRLSLLLVTDSVAALLTLGCPVVQGYFLLAISLRSINQRESLRQLTFCMIRHLTYMWFRKEKSRLRKAIAYVLRLSY